jgi:periplasmic glucans biosynthesis protein
MPIEYLVPAAAALPPALDRRKVLLLGSIGLAGLAWPARAQAQGYLPQAVSSALGEGQPFNATTVVDMARFLSKKSYQAPGLDLPEPFNALNYEQYIGIRARPSTVLWSGDPVGFSLEPLHRGFAFQAPVALFAVENSQVRQIVYDRGQFDFGRLQPPASLPDLGFSGFRIFGDAQNGVSREVAIFQGASFFRTSARGQNLGIMARGLTLKAGDPKGEEFPAFRAFWIEKPEPGAQHLMIHALLDSESVTGAFRFTLRPGDVTIIDTECTLFARAAVENYGLAGMTTTYFFGPNDRRNVDDPRAGVYESNGLQIHNGNGEWIWRPLSNPETLQISAFVDPAPRGFGLIQRERDYGAFQDDDQMFERRPSLWIEPIGDWSAGMVQLIEIPTESEINDNVVCYWRPGKPLAAGGEAAFAYRQFWGWLAPDKPDLAMVTATRAGQAAASNARRFVVDFTGDKLKDAQTILAMTPAVAASPGAISQIRVWPYPERRTARVAFTLDPGNDTMSELRLVLEANGKPLSETWLYRWTP